MSVSDLNEFTLIQRFFNRGSSECAFISVGDDAALLKPLPEGQSLAVSTDMMLLDRHFTREVDPRSLGHKLLAVNLSDMAAVGANPLSFTLALALPHIDENWLELFCKGLFYLADEWNCPLVGGDTCKGALGFSVTILGTVLAEQAFRRDAAMPGDDIWISGNLGAAAFALSKRLSGSVLSTEIARSLDWPTPRVGLGLALRGLVHSAIDVSDGLLGDLRHILEKSNVGARVFWQDIPVSPILKDLSIFEQQRFVLSGGEDYELLFTALPENRSKIELAAAEIGQVIQRIGTIVEELELKVFDISGSLLSIPSEGYDHFP